MIKKSAQSARNDTVGGDKRRLRRLLKYLGVVFCLWVLVSVVVWDLGKTAIKQISELTGAKVSATSVRVQLNGHVRISGLSVSPYQEKKYKNTLLRAARVDARFSPMSFLLLRPRLKELKVEHFVFDAQYDLDTGLWNVGELNLKFPSRGDKSHVPVVNLRYGMLSYSKVISDEIQTVAAIPVEARLAPADANIGGYEFEIATAEHSRFGKSRLTGNWRPGIVTLAGGVASADVAAFERVWAIGVMAGELRYGAAGEYGLKLRIRDMVTREGKTESRFVLDGERYVGKMGPFAALQVFFDRYRPSGRLDIELNASGNLNEPAKSVLNCTVECRDIWVCDRRFEYPLEHVAGKITLDLQSQRLEIAGLEGRHGDVNMQVRGLVEGFGDNQQQEMIITSDNMLLDGTLYRAMNKQQQAFWSSFAPSGRVGVNYRITQRSGEQSQSTLAVELQEVDAVYSQFKYPLRGLRGLVVFEGEEIRLKDVVSAYDGRQILLNGRIVTGEGQVPEYKVDIRTTHIPLDSTLFGALNESQRSISKALSVRGFADAQVQASGGEGGMEPTYAARVQARDCTLDFSGLMKSRAGVSVSNEPNFAVYNASAELMVTPGLMDIEQLNGRYEGGSVSITGRLSFEGGEAVPLCHVSVTAKEVSLNEALMGLLPESAREFVSEWHVDGKTNIIAEIKQENRQSEPEIGITFDFLGDSVSARYAQTKETAGGEMKWFLPVLRDITGRLTITREKIGFEHIRGYAAATEQTESTGRSLIDVDGELSLKKKDYGQGSFRVHVEDFCPESRFAAILPGGARPYYTALMPVGRLGADFNEVRVSTRPDGSRWVDFGGTVTMKSCGLVTEPAVTDISGEVKVGGRYQVGVGLQDAEAAVIAEALKIKGLSLRDFKSDFRYDPNTQGWFTERMTGESNNGRLSGKLALKKPGAAAMSYVLEVGFDGIDLNKFLNETQEKSRGDAEQSSGRMCGSLCVSGLLGQDNKSRERTGTCKVSITDMRVGKLSAFAKLLYLLQLTQTGDFAFDRMLLESYIRDNRLFLRHIDLWGKAIHFGGSGWMDLSNQKLDMVLLAGNSGSGGSNGSVFRSLTDSLGSAMVRIEVGGYYYDPKVTTETLPVIKDTLKILGTKTKQ